MLRTLFLTAGALTALSGAARAQTAPDYVKMAGASDKFEITEAKLAEQRSRNPKIRKFAAMMIQDHTRSTMKVKTAAHKVMGHNPAPPMMDEEQTRNLAALKSTKGPREFDKTYVDQQVAAHQKALDLHQGYAQNGDAPPLKMAAKGIVPVVQHHLEMAKEMQSSMN